MSATAEGHTVKRYDEELSQLLSVVLEMGGLVEDQVRRAVKALRHEDVEDAREIIARDHIVNGYDVRADEQVVRLLALRQPKGSDLRTVMALVKTVSDLERIGDEAERIARMTVHIFEGDGTAPRKRLFRDVKSMGKLAAGLLNTSLDALARLDVERAISVTQDDSELDQEFQAALRRLITYIMEDSRQFGHAIDAVFVIKALERIGDHAKNIAEYVVYQVKGKDVRHISPDAIVENIQADA